MRIAPRSFKALLAHSFINCSATLGQCARIDKHTRCVLGYKAVSIQVVHFHESNAGGVIHATHDHGVVTCCQICDDCGFPSITRCVTTGLNLAKLITGDNPANDWRHPVVIGCNQSSRAVVQLQCRITQHIWKPVLGKLRTNGADNDSPWLSPLNNELPVHTAV